MNGDIGVRYDDVVRFIPKQELVSQICSANQTGLDRRKSLTQIPAVISENNQLALIHGRRSMQKKYSLPAQMESQKSVEGLQNTQTAEIIIEIIYIRSQNGYFTEIFFKNYGSFIALPNIKLGILDFGDEIRYSAA